MLNTRRTADLYTTSKSLAHAVQKHFQILSHLDIYDDGSITYVISRLPHDELFHFLDTTQQRFPLAEYEAWSTGAHTRCVRLRAWYNGALCTLTTPAEISACFTAHLLDPHAETN